MRDASWQVLCVAGAMALGSCKSSPLASADADDTETSSEVAETGDSAPYTHVAECWTDGVPSGAGYAETLAAHEGACFRTARFEEGCGAAVSFMISSGESWSSARFDHDGAPVTRCYGYDYDLPCPSGPPGAQTFRVCSGSRERCAAVEAFDSPGCVPAEVDPPAWGGDTCERLDYEPGPALLADREAALHDRCYGRAVCTSPEGAERVVLVESTGFEGGPPPTAYVYDAVSGVNVARWQPYGGSNCVGGTWWGPAHPDCYRAPLSPAGICGIASLP